jgi:signal transduction histidine kinase
VAVEADSDKTAALVHLAGAIAHELNNIFTAVAGNLSLITEQTQKGDHSDTIDEVVRTAQRGIALSERLQAFAGRQPLRRRNVDIERLLGDFRTELIGRLPKSITVKYSRIDGEFVSYVDERKLYECLNEIATNAVAAMNGHGVLSLELFSREAGAGERGLRSGAYLVIRMTDTGSGMQPEIAARALDPMFSTRSSGIHAGWGLSYCAGFCRQSGGLMKVHTRLNHGTSVEVILPAGSVTHAPLGSTRLQAVQKTGTRK